MKTFFWGFFSTPWKRLFRTISVIVILIFSFIFFDSYSDEDKIICFTVISLIPILSYVIEPFVLKSKISNVSDDDLSIKSELHSKVSEQSNSNQELTNLNLQEKSKFKNYFTFNNEYLTGLSYLNRMIIGILTSWIFGLGIFLMVASIFKRSKSLGFGNTLTIINCIIIPSALILNLVIRETERRLGSSDDPLMIILPLVFSIPHLILLFKNGIRNRNGGFRV
jgi:hypothetical protein